MPVLAATITTTTSHEVKLKPTLKRKLLTELKTYAELKFQRDAIDQALKGHKGTIEECLGEAGETTLSVEGFKTTMVSPVRSILDKKKLIEQGVSTAQIENATVNVTSRSYLKITCPGEKGGSESE
mgnify:FL=1